MDVKVAVASGLGNAKELLEKVKAGEADYHFIEIMGCPGGCVNGGGQPQQPGHVRNTTDIRGLRAKVLYNIDSANPIRKSHEESCNQGTLCSLPGPAWKRGSAPPPSHHVRKEGNQ